MSESHKQADGPSQPRVAAGHFLAGASALVILAVVGIVSLAHGARWLGFTHFGGIVESVEVDLDTWDFATPEINVWADVEPSRGMKRYSRGQLMARVMAGDEGVESYLSDSGLKGAGRMRIGLKRIDGMVNEPARAAFKAGDTVIIKFEEVEFGEDGGMETVKSLGDFEVPFAVTPFAHLR